VTLLGTAIAALFGRDILQLVFTQKYSSSAPVFTILMFNLSIALISNVMGNTLVAVGDTQKPAIINFFNAVVSWVGSFLLVPMYALVGASVANTIGTAVAFPLNRYFLHKRIGLEDMPYLKPIIFLSVWGLLVFIIKPEMPLIKAAFLVVYILGCIFLSIVTKADIALLIAGSGISSWPRLRKLRLWISGS
jgi:O-antigen/teichoic acid export membrane protein